jgi:hypothetical protein
MKPIIEALARYIDREEFDLPTNIIVICFFGSIPILSIAILIHGLPIK